MSEHVSMDHQKRMTVSALSVIACYIPVHGYRFFHLLASGDALLQLYQDDAAWEISLGRFLQPFVVLFRGGITAPFLIGLLSVLWLVLSVYFAGLFLELHTKTSVALLSAFFVINRTTVMMNSSYLPWADIYMLALLAAVAGVFAASGTKPVHILCGAVLLAASLGLYQAYICVALGLAAIRLITDLAGGTDHKTVLRRTGGQACAFALSAVLYLLAWKGLQRALHIWTSDGYNGMTNMSGVGDMANTSLLGVVYGNVWRYYLEPARIKVMTFRGTDLGDIWVWVFRLANVCVTVLIVYYLVKRNRENRTTTAARALQVVLFALLPLCVNLVCLLSGGMQHVLMMYAFNLHYVTFIVLQEQEYAPRLRRVFLLLVFLLLWPVVVYANQIYLKKALQEEAAQSLLVRVVEEIEGTEGYIPGETPVAFAGSLERNPYVADNDLLTDEMPWGEMKTAFTYGGMEARRLAAFEHITVNTDAEVPEGGMLDEMPCFPVEGSVRFADGVLVVKLSE